MTSSRMERENGERGLEVVSVESDGEPSGRGITTHGSWSEEW